MAAEVPDGALGEIFIAEIPRRSAGGKWTTYAANLGGSGWALSFSATEALAAQVPARMASGPRRVEQLKKKFMRKKLKNYQKTFRGSPFSIARRQQMQLQEALWPRLAAWGVIFKGSGGQHSCRRLVKDVITVCATVAPVRKLNSPGKLSRPPAVARDCFLCRCTVPAEERLRTSNACCVGVDLFLNDSFSQFKDISRRHCTQCYRIGGLIVKAQLPEAMGSMLAAQYLVHNVRNGGGAAVCNGSGGSGQGRQQPWMPNIGKALEMGRDLISWKDLTLGGGSGYCPPTARFGNPSTFQDDYGSKRYSQRELFKPPNVPNISDVPFDGLTNHKISYVPHSLGDCYVRPQDEYKPNDKSFEGFTIHRHDYRGILGVPTKSFKPEQSKLGSDVPSEGSSEFRDRYQAWPVTLPYLHKHPDYMPPDGPMDLNSTSHLDYVGHKVKPPAPFRPASARKVHAPFQDSTTLKDDFKQWDVKKTEMIKRAEEMLIPSVKFDDLTISKANYVPHPINPTQSFKPIDLPLHSKTPFDAGTLYHIEYTPKKLEICPASYPTPPGYVYENTDSRGHKFFHKVTASKENLTVRNEKHLSKEVAVAS
uniref:stabilizer of axonemal microtubules 1-like n=1 Tax=Pristiophorus japonicus TaxID=55135 RepID=UPI00398E9368